MDLRTVNIEVLRIYISIGLSMLILISMSTLESSVSLANQKHHQRRLYSHAAKVTGQRRPCRIPYNNNTKDFMLL
jgi:cell division protein FtsL